MTNLILNSLEIQGFRAFKNLTIEKLGRVNLIVGKNNVGKSSVLEALRIYANRGSASLLNRILQERNERAMDARGRNLNALGSIHNIFYDRGGRNTRLFMSIGQINDDQKISIKLDRSLQSSVFEIDDPDIFNEMGDEFEIIKSLDSNLVIEFREKHMSYQIPIKYPESLLVSGELDVSPVNMSFIPSGGLKNVNLARLWNNIALTDLEPLVISSLQIITPEIERLNFLIERSNDPIPIVRAKGYASRVPLSSLGEGMNRIFGIALSLVSARNGLLLVDEIESGLHYSVQTDMWRLIFETARRLNIQVVATTHSWDCIQGFQQAAQEDEQSEGMLIRLGRRQQETVATLYSEQELEIVTREQIEVR